MSERFTDGSDVRFRFEEREADEPEGYVDGVTIEHRGGGYSFDSRFPNRVRLDIVANSALARELMDLVEKKLGIGRTPPPPRRRAEPERGLPPARKELPPPTLESKIIDGEFEDP